MTIIDQVADTSFTRLVPVEVPDQSEIDIGLDVKTPWATTWWLRESLTEVPPDAVGWLVAQGWQITLVTYLNTTRPPTPRYKLERDVLQPIKVLQSLLNAYTDAYNDARKFNNERYNEVVTDWTQMIASSRVHHDAQVTEQNRHGVLYLGNVDTYMDEIRDLINANQADLATAYSNSTAILGNMDTKLSDLESNITDASGTHGVVTTKNIEGLLKNQEDYLGTLRQALIDIRTELDTNYEGPAGVTGHRETITDLLGDSSDDLKDLFTDIQDDQLWYWNVDLTAYGTAYSNFLSVDATPYLTAITNDIDDMLTAISDDYDDVADDIDTLVLGTTTAASTMDSTLDTHVTDYNKVVKLLAADHADNVTNATAFLTNLGTTELLRINEAAAATLSVQNQQLVDRGLYSSGVSADISARNARDRSEEVGILNDRLNRQKFDNQHKLYEQQVVMRTGTMGGKEKVHGLKQELLRYQTTQVLGMHTLQQQLRERTVNGKQAIAALKDANLKLEMEVTDKLHALDQAMRRLVIEEAARRQQLSLAITQWKTGQQDKLYDQIQSIVAQHTASFDRQHALEQSVIGGILTQRNVLLQQVQDAAKGIIAGKERYATANMQNATALAESGHRMIVEKMNEFVYRQESLQGKHEEAMKLMAYHLNERNQLLIGIYGFVERREDTGPGIEDLTKLCVGLGDSGGGWVTP